MTYESSVNKEYTKLQEASEMFCEVKNAHRQTFKGMSIKS
jgi:hypothetical protein